MLTRRNLSNTYNVLEEIEEVLLQHMSIKEVHIETFNGLLNLTEIDLSYNFIEEIKDNIFKGLSNLITISFNDNRLTNINEQLFVGLNSLKKIYLHNNIFRNNKLSLYLENSVEYVSIKHTVITDKTNIPNDKIECIENKTLLNPDLLMIPVRIYFNLKFLFCTFKTKFIVKIYKTLKMKNNLSGRMQYGNRFELLASIGSGGFGQVSKIRNLISNESIHLFSFKLKIIFFINSKSFALKKITIAGSKKEFVKSREGREAKILFDLRNLNFEGSEFIIKYQSCFFVENLANNFFIAMELCEVKLIEKKNFFFKNNIIYLTLQTDLACKIRPARASRTQFDYHIIKKWSQEMISGIAFLHKTYDMKSEIIHRDIKPGFVFLIIIIFLFNI